MAKAAVEKKVKCEEYYLTGDERFDKAWTDFDKYVRHELADKYRIILSHAYSAVAFTECFLFCLYDRMKMNLLVNPELKSCSAIFNEFFELRAYAIPSPDGGVKIKFNLCPEKYGKCGIKDDGTTEREVD